MKSRQRPSHPGPGLGGIARVAKRVNLPTGDEHGSGQG
jgi:hypothetical protein